MGLCLSVGGRRKRREGRRRSEGHDDALCSEVVKEVLPTTQIPTPSFAPTASASLAPPNHDVGRSKIFQRRHHPTPAKLSISDAPASGTCSATRSISLSIPTLTEDRNGEIEEETGKLSRVAQLPRMSPPSPNPLPPKVKHSLPGETTERVRSASGVRRTPSPALVRAERSFSRNKQQQKANVGGTRAGGRSKSSTRACENADGATAGVGSGAREMIVRPYTPPPKSSSSSSTSVPPAREEKSKGREEEEEKGGDLGWEETMDDTLVSLECFIFL